MTNPAHNISQDQQYAAFQINRVANLQKEADSATAAYSSALGKMEANGLDKQAVKEALKIRKKGPAEVTAAIARFKKLLEYLKAINLPVEDNQLDMFPAVSHEEPLEDRAFRMGVLTGAMGEGMDKNPHSPETEAGQAWLNGFHEGSDSYRRFKQEADEEEAEAAEVVKADDGQQDIEDDD
ncbi:hypothetical protein [Roseibium alexandrii]|uniref:hypothetical protein n=1 Tax=Roseibium alexandrii TaxID=388408 RepID=UPI0037502D5A